MAGHPTRVAGRWVRHALAPGRTPPTAVRLKMHGEPYDVHLDLDPSGQLLAASVDRWGPG